MNLKPKTTSAELRLHRGDDLPFSQWDTLETGCRVVIQRDGEAITRGEVDVVSPGASVFWVWLEDGRGRIAVYEEEHTTVWLADTHVP